MRTLTSVVLLALSGAFASPALADAALKQAIADDYTANLKALFLHLHQNPELSFLEFKTAERFAGELKSLGYEVTTGVGKTGVVGVLKNGAGPTVMLRADMDGLPVEEKSGLPYASKARQVDLEGVDQPVMHARGHDVHMTAMIGAARQLMARKSEWSGTLVIIGQPAEEGMGGAKAMMEDGLYKRFPKPEYALALHVKAELPAGKIGVPLDVAYSGADTVEIVVRGVSAHGAAPQKGVDPVVVASSIVMNLQTLTSRTLSPFEPGVITVGAMHGGVRPNIIPDEVKLLLTVRSDTPETRKKLLEGIERVAAGTAEALNVPKDRLPVVKHGGETSGTPPTVNDHATAQRVRDAMARELGAARMLEPKRENMGAEDFAYFVAKDTGVKGVYFEVGGTKESDVAKAPSHHSGLFKIEPEPAVTSGAEAMVVGALELMKKVSAGK